MKWLKTILVGVMTGVTLFNLMGLPFMDMQTRNSLLGVMLLGAVIGGLSRLYDTRLPLLAASLLHIGASLAAFLVAAYLGQWFPFDLGILVSAVGSFLVIFLAIWTGYYFYEKKKLARINEGLR